VSQSAKNIPHRFISDLRGQFAFLTVIGLIPLTFLTFSIVNSGSAIQDATRSQDAADMIALVHAAEGARSMNTLAMNHVSLTQNYAAAVHASSLDNAITIHNAVLSGAIAEAGIYITDTCDFYPRTFGGKIGGILFAICAAPATAYIGELALEIDRAQGIRRDYRPEDALAISGDALRALSDQNREIFDRFPEAVSEQASLIAEAHNVTDIYFDESCARGDATSCNPQDRRQGMELPVTINEPSAAYLNFCAGLFFGTGGLSSANLPILDQVPGLSSFASVPLMNGSFEQRLFPLNQGPMHGGAANGDRYLPVHVSKTSEMGYALEDYQDMAHQKRLYDGVINVFRTPAELTAFTARLASRLFWGRSTSGMQRDAEQSARNLLDTFIIDGTSTADYHNGPGFAYPMDQTPDTNIFTIMVEARIGAQCTGQIGQANNVGSQLTSFVTGVPGLGGLFSTVPDFDLYHPVQGSGSITALPTITPDLDDFHDAYRPLAFVFREGANRWSPLAFRDPNPGFVRYAQGITYNPDEISMYSQNWRARLIPATRMLDRATVVQRMEGRVPPAFDDFRSDLHAVGGAAGWADLVTR